MYVLNLDKNFSPCSDIKGTPHKLDFETFKFSGGEIQFKLKNRNDIYEKIDKVTITCRVNTSDDFMRILIAKDALGIKGIRRFDLVMPYIPYARQDRVCADGESFSLKVFADILNSLNFENVYTLDAHSDVSVSLIKNCVNFSNQRYVNEALLDIGKTLYLISPDLGADKKSERLFEQFTQFDGIIKCGKKRNPDTGALSGFQVFCEDLKGKDCIIVDDICDGGGTFLGIAQELKKKNAGDIYLFVTHGIFSKGFTLLKEYFKKIYTTDSICSISEDIKYVKQFKVEI
jgi:ribose-phosphate pyrophosphokinase